MWFFKRIAEFWRGLNMPVDPATWANPPQTRRPDIDEEINRVRVENLSIHAALGSRPVTGLPAGAAPLTIHEDPWPREWNDRGVSDIAEAIEYRGICEVLAGSEWGDALAIFPKSYVTDAPYVSVMREGATRYFESDTVIEALRLAYRSIVGREWRP